jgi:hypothetical protein
VQPQPSAKVIREKKKLGGFFNPEAQHIAGTPVVEKHGENDTQESELTPDTAGILLDSRCIEFEVFLDVAMTAMDYDKTCC